MAFSPTAEALLHEAKRIAANFSSQLILIHVGNKNKKSESKMQAILQKVGIQENEVQVIWKVGKPVGILNQVCAEENVDLLVLGAKRNEAAYRYYIGSVARKISRNPSCSLLLVTEPSKKAAKLKKVVVNGINHSKTANTLETAFEFSSKYPIKEFTIVEEVKPSKVKTRIDDHITLKEAYNEKEALERLENKRIQDLISPYKSTIRGKITQKCVFGKIGYSIGHYAEISRANLLVMNSPDSKLGFLDRFFPHDLEYVLSDMPCDLMIVHPKKS